MLYYLIWISHYLVIPEVEGTSAVKVQGERIPQTITAERV